MKNKTKLVVGNKIYENPSADMMEQVHGTSSLSRMPVVGAAKNITAYIAARRRHTSWCNRTTR